LFLLAGTFWVFEVMPIGVTGLLIGVIQALFFIRPASEAFKDFMDPSVLFIFGSLTIGMVFTKVGLTKRLAYKMLMIVGERTSRIYLGCFVVTALLTHIMAHTAVAATMYPLLLAIYSLYTTDTKPTRFGKGLVHRHGLRGRGRQHHHPAGRGPGHRGPGLLQEIAGQGCLLFRTQLLHGAHRMAHGLSAVGFYHGAVQTRAGPHPRSAGEGQTAQRRDGPLSRKEIGAGLIVLGAILFLSLQSFVSGPAALQQIGRDPGGHHFVFPVQDILDIQDLELIPWNIILLFAGAMSIGFCLWQTGAAEWLAINWLGFFKDAHWFIFVMGISFLSWS
jgi:solute carrier family 13 (sodium-dependent dicarboxylate transporter), member 2/3/5